MAFVGMPIAGDYWASKSAMSHTGIAIRGKDLAQQQRGGLAAITIKDENQMPNGRC